MIHRLHTGAVDSAAGAKAEHDPDLGRGLPASAQQALRGAKGFDGQDRGEAPSRSLAARLARSAVSLPTGVEVEGRGHGWRVTLDSAAGAFKGHLDQAHPNADVDVHYRDGESIAAVFPESIDSSIRIDAALAENARRELDSCFPCVKGVEASEQNVVVKVGNHFRASDADDLARLLWIRVGQVPVHVVRDVGEDAPVFSRRSGVWFDQLPDGRRAVSFESESKARECIEALGLPVQVRIAATEMELTATEPLAADAVDRVLTQIRQVVPTDFFELTTPGGRFLAVPTPRNMSPVDSVDVAKLKTFVADWNAQRDSFSDTQLFKAEVSRGLFGGESVVLHALEPDADEDNSHWPADCAQALRDALGAPGLRIEFQDPTQSRTERVVARSYEVGFYEHAPRADTREVRAWEDKQRRSLSDAAKQRSLALPSIRSARAEVLDPEFTEFMHNQKGSVYFAPDTGELYMDLPTRREPRPGLQLRCPHFWGNVHSGVMMQVPLKGSIQRFNVQTGWSEGVERTSNGLLFERNGHHLKISNAEGVQREFVELHPDRASALISQMAFERMPRKVTPHGLIALPDGRYIYAVERGNTAELFDTDVLAFEVYIGTPGQMRPVDVVDQATWSSTLIETSVGSFFVPSDREPHPMSNEARYWAHEGGSAWFHENGRDRIAAVNMSERTEARDRVIASLGVNHGRDAKLPELAPAKEGRRLALTK